ncbi:retrovirus-related pol polyprotein from transposon TNT 1-94 [Tanacetum coccineum]
MSTSKTYQQSLADAGSENRPPMLERGSYIPWASRFRRYLNRKRDNRKWLLKALDEGPYEFKNFLPEGSTIPRLQTIEDLEGDDLLLYDAEMELMNMILLSIPNEIYNSVDACTSAKDMWKRVERLMRGTIQNRFATGMVEICDSAKKLEKSHDPLALVAHTGSSSRQTSSYYVTHPTSVVDYDDEYQQDDVHNNSEDPLVSAMLLLKKAITQNFSNPTNNRLQVVEGMNAPNETGNVQRTLCTRSSGNTSTVQCYNYSGKGHYARNCPKPRNDFLFGDALRMEEIEELSANICLMAIIQPADHYSDDGPSYESAFISEGNVNSGSVDKNTQVPDLCAVENLA